MQLQAKRPPGRADRKAGAYASEIIRMRAEGYTYSAILEALESVGITTTEGSLRREMRRPQKHLKLKVSSISQLPEQIHSPSPAPTPHADLPESVPPKTTSARGRDIAEAFFNAHPSNPLFRLQESS